MPNETPSPEIAALTKRIEELERTVNENKAKNEAEKQCPFKLAGQGLVAELKRFKQHFIIACIKLKQDFKEEYERTMASENADGSQEEPKPTSPSSTASSPSYKVNNLAEFHAQTIDVLLKHNLSEKTLNLLKEAGLNTISDVMMKTKLELLAIPGIGEVRHAELTAALDSILKTRQ